MTSGEVKMLMQQFGHLVQNIEKQNKVLTEINETLKEKNKNTIEVSLSSRISDEHVFVTKMHISEITEQSSIDNMNILLKSLGNVLLIMKDEQ